jgi:uncharacterized membrane protein YtjA (UPF0391 family)
MPTVRITARWSFSPIVPGDHAGNNSPENEGVSSPAHLAWPGQIVGRDREEVEMMRWVFSFLITAVIAVLLATAEIVVVAVNTERILLVVLLALFLSPLWLTSFLIRRKGAP